ncbi:aldo/keto reductase [Romeria aff. gracilis LEGE 07310]|uniref:Aldo/keto reductase n=1 Tax=Vasconcelosia minhoensis LEGE 07310 TaxID=915328 RepID=A0A8J7AXJ4_9CYAN|nr:aldo/keto reductase [Romeria gracilis]MBE9079353.1 aldo/keto reductase [Romeria aff. gracilis LEGE 07310]
MRYRRFGKTQLNLSVFSLGTMRFASAQVAHQVLSAAIAQGINHIETARSYGQSETWIGQALKAGVGVARSQLVLTSKVAPNPDEAAVERQLEESLTRLGVDCLDCVAVHGLNTPQHLDWVLASQGTLAVLRRAQADGRVRHIGFSTHGPLAVIEGAIASDAFAFVNLHYSYFFQRNVVAVAQAAARDIGIFIISPADKGGLLYTPPDRLKALCAPYDPLLLTYRWLLSDPRITTLSLGPAVPEELDWPLQVADSTDPLTPDEQAAFARLAQQQAEQLGTDRCSQCYQCLPCPEEIHIPEVLRLRNLAVAYGMSDFGEYRYRMFEQAGHWFPGRRGDRCTDCGDCLPRCPEQLDIPTLLRDTHERLKGPARRRLWD